MPDNVLQLFCDAGSSKGLSPDWWMVDLTKALVAAAVAQVIAAFLQCFVVWRTLFDTQRAQVYCGIQSNPQPGGRLEVNVWLKNSGPTPAYASSMICLAEFADYLHIRALTKFKQTVPTHGLIPPQSADGLDNRMVYEIQPTAEQLSSSTADALCVYGWTEYVDTFGRRYRLAFGYYYNTRRPGAQGWVHIPDRRFHSLKRITRLTKARDAVSDFFSRS